MQTPIGTRSRQVRTPKQPERLASDVLLAVGTDHPKFWFLAWLDATHKLATMKRLMARALGAKRQDALTLDALSSCVGHFGREQKDMVDHCQRAGLLPLCWEGTRAMNDVGVAA